MNLDFLVYHFDVVALWAAEMPIVSLKVGKKHLKKCKRLPIIVLRGLIGDWSATPRPRVTQREPLEPHNGPSAWYPACSSSKCANPHCHTTALPRVRLFNPRSKISSNLSLQPPSLAPLKGQGLAASCPQQCASIGTTHCLLWAQSL